MILQAEKWAEWQLTQIQGPNSSKGISAKERDRDFDEIVVPIVNMTSIRTVLSIAASMNMEIEQLDVKTTFLHGE